ncbi:hypothetical protein DID88_008447 [Monilinia fructigena]|uniref:DRBM domain-containing protein n=1 Tax=Monilinia fructigena TaxID=38457 RepID=A0A395J6D6_9HELO|nr:hypothetical protein DID88_008447 [Monilinia fructigena]
MHHTETVPESSCCVAWFQILPNIPSSFVNSRCGSSIRPASIPAEYNAIPEPAPHCFSSTLLALRSSLRPRTHSNLLVRRHCLKCLVQHTTLAQVHGKRSLKMSRGTDSPSGFQIVSDRRGGRTAWSSTVTVQGQNISARFWYDGQYVNNAKEDAAEVALNRLSGSSPTSPTQSRSSW